MKIVRKFSFDGETRLKYSNPLGRHIATFGYNAGGVPNEWSVLWLAKGYFLDVDTINDAMRFVESSSRVSPAKSTEPSPIAKASEVSG